MVLHSQCIHFRLLAQQLWFPFMWKLKLNLGKGQVCQPMPGKKPGENRRRRHLPRCLRNVLGRLLLLLGCSVVSDSETPQTAAHQPLLSVGFSKQEYWCALPFPSLGDLPDPGIGPVSLALQADSLPLSHQGSIIMRGIYLESGACLVVQMVKNLPAMQETCFWSLGQEEPLEKGMATHSSVLAGESHGQRSVVGYRPWGCKESIWLSD